MTTSATKFISLLCIGFFAIAATGCKEQGPFERAGEEVDEAANTLKNGEESTATKIDDAADEVRDGVKDAADDLKK
jgi:hypothetical protein